MDKDYCETRANIKDIENQTLRIKMKQKKMDGWLDSAAAKINNAAVFQSINSGCKSETD